MIDEHFNSIEKIIHEDPLVILINLERTYTSTETGYIKGDITFIDRSSLTIFQHVRIDKGIIIITDYRYHYMDANNKLIFRYDNAPHHPEINTFPHHVHYPVGIKEANRPVIEDVLTKIDYNIIQKIK